jgi:hypothetical protein
MKRSKKKPISNYQKAQIRMKQETCRAIAHVKLLENLYLEMMKEKGKK